MVELIPLNVKYAGDQGELLGVKGRDDIAIFRVPPSSLTPYNVALTMRSLAQEGAVNNCVLDLRVEGYPPRWRADRAVSFANLAKYYHFRDSYAGLDVREINHHTIETSKYRHGVVKDTQRIFSGKIIGATVDEVVGLILEQKISGASRGPNPA